MIQFSDMDSNIKLVSMRATFTTDGNWGEKRRRVVNERMNPDPLINASTLQDALEYFKSQVQYVDEIEEFETVVIDGKEYYDDHWEDPE